MNIYVRYFGEEGFFYSAEEVIDFLSSIAEITITPQLVADVTNYINGDMPYPKRYKVRPRIYFIMIKTTAQSMEEFRANNRNSQVAEINDGRQTSVNVLAEERVGWYKASILFKRVIQVPGTSKFQYKDTTFSVLLKAGSAQHCYERIVDHLKNRQDVDYRSQFPSARGSNFRCEYLGEQLEVMDN